MKTLYILIAASALISFVGQCIAQVHLGLNGKPVSVTPASPPSTTLVSQKDKPSNSVAATNAISGAENQEAFIFIWFRIDEIVPQKGFISRAQKKEFVGANPNPAMRGVEPFTSSMSKRTDNYSAYISMTNTDNLITGEWIDGWSTRLIKDGVMTNGTEHLQIYIVRTPSLPSPEK